jgi:hypothetical protein
MPHVEDEDDDDDDDDNNDNNNNNFTCNLIFRYALREF